MTLIEEANKVYLKNFSNETCFERAVFFSWGCSIRDCTFCYMSTQPEGKAIQETRRSSESLLAEFIIAKHCNWDIGFFSGGIGAFNPIELKELLKQIHEIVGKVWLNIGPVSKKILEEFAPYIVGVVGSIETIDPKLHQKICPSKPIEPYEKMFEAARELGLSCGMTFIVGLGEKKEDYPLLENFIKKQKITKIHFYGLNPQKGTPFENALPPSIEEQSWWIAKTRLAFPKIDIQCGIWLDRVDYIPKLLQAGANSISKFPAIRRFNSNEAKEIEHQVEISGRKFKGSLTIIPQIDVNEEINKLSLSNEMKEKVKSKLDQYLKQMKKKSLKEAQVLNNS